MDFGPLMFMLVEVQHDEERDAGRERGREGGYHLDSFNIMDGETQ